MTLRATKIPSLEHRTHTGRNGATEKEETRLPAPRPARIPPLTVETETTDTACPCWPHPRPHPPDTSMVVNLSGTTLSDAELSLLSKGLSFCPAPPKPDAFQMEMDLGDFYRRLRLKEFLYNSDADDAERPIQTKKEEMDSPHQPGACPGDLHPDSQ